MTTERRQVSPKARVRVSPLELRLYVVALLAAVYTISWRAIGAHAPATEPVVASTPPASEPQRVVWITLPDGWQLASQQQASPPARVVHVPNRRVPRIRTRSS